MSQTLNDKIRAVVEGAGPMENQGMLIQELQNLVNNNLVLSMNVDVQDAINAVDGMRELIVEANKMVAWVEEKAKLSGNVVVVNTHYYQLKAALDKIGKVSLDPVSEATHQPAPVAAAVQGDALVKAACRSKDLQDASYQQGRAAGLEEAAKVCDKQASEPECPERAQYCADAIRAINTAPPAQDIERDAALHLIGWREWDDRWVFHDVQDDPELCAHIAEHQKETHGVSVWPVYCAAMTAQQSEKCDGSFFNLNGVNATPDMEEDFGRLLVKVRTALDFVANGPPAGLEIPQAEIDKKFDAIVADLIPEVQTMLESRVMVKHPFAVLADMTFVGATGEHRYAQSVANLESTSDQLIRAGEKNDYYLRTKEGAAEVIACLASMATSMQIVMNLYGWRWDDVKLKARQQMALASE